jgi:uncharacterized protein YkwD
MKLRALSVTAAAGVSLVLTAGAAGPALAAPTVTAAMVAQEDRVTQLVNAHRAKVGCPALRTDIRLTRAARGHSQDMAARAYFSHTTPGGTTPWTRIARQGYPRVAEAENIAAGQPNAAAVVGAWMRSAGHRANILNCSMRATGVGLAYGGPYRYYWTQDFGAR